MVGHVFVLFGATGDLAKKKLYSTLYELYKDRLDEPYRIIGVARKKMSDKGYRDFVAKHSKGAPKFLKNFQYVSGDIDDPALYDALRERLGEKCNIVFYLAIPPSLFGRVAEGLKSVGLSQEKGCWRRLVIEKPFGRDLESARKLNREVTAAFAEEQIFRIDHYLGKELVQETLVMRFTNTIFEQVWGREYVDHIQITVSEDFGIEGRGTYYDSTGCLRDMIQNHLLQMLCLTTMEPPATVDPEHIRDEKVKLLKSLQRFSEKTVKNVVSGQYKGYKDEREVDTNSKTETFIALKTEIHNLRWGNIPVYMRTGKHMKSRFAEINLVLKDLPCVLFCQLPSATLMQNRITVRVQPMEGVSIQFNTKIPGTGYLIKPQVLEYCQECRYGPKSPQAYEFLLHDVIIGDATRFTRWDEVEEAWKFIDSITKNWKRRPELYKKGSWGPESADELIEKDGRKWINHEKPRRIG